MCTLFFVTSRVSSWVPFRCVCRHVDDVRSVYRPPLVELISQQKTQLRCLGPHVWNYARGVAVQDVEDSVNKKIVFT